MIPKIHKTHHNCPRHGTAVTWSTISLTIPRVSLLLVSQPHLSGRRTLSPPGLGLCLPSTPWECIPHSSDATVAQLSRVPGQERDHVPPSDGVVNDNMTPGLPISLSLSCAALWVTPRSESTGWHADTPECPTYSLSSASERTEKGNDQSFTCCSSCSSH